MAWLGFGGIILLVLGTFAPELGLILGRDFGHASLALWIAGIAALIARALLYKPRGVRKASIDSDGNFSDASDLGHHNGHDGHGGDNGDGGH